MTRLEIPAIRSDLEVVATGKERFSWSLRDGLLGQQVGLDAVGHLIVGLLSRPRSARDLLRLARAKGARGLDEVLLSRHVRFLARRGAFEGPRATVIRGASQAPAKASDTEGPLPFAFVEGLQHACQACGSCCSATDVGPIPQPVVDRILEHDWVDHIDGLESNEQLFRSGEHDGQPIYLTQMSQDQCVFLGRDKLCLIHGQLGVDKKPTPCRQFPYVFANEGDRIAVSLQMECRAYLAAKRAASPPAQQEGELRELLSIGAPVHQVPTTVSVDAGLQISRARYLSLEYTIVEAVRGGDPRASALWGPLGDYARAADAQLTSLFSEIDHAERSYVALSSWEAAFPGTFADPPDPASNFLAGLSRFQQQVHAFVDEAARMAAQRGLPWLEQRLHALDRAIAAASGGLDASAFRVSDPEAVRTILTDVITSSLFAKEAIRRGSLRFGLSLLGLRTLLIIGGAANRAKEACRVEIHTQDVIDTMVAISKMLRERAVLSFLSGLETSMISLFLTNLEVFTKTSAPRLEAPGGIQ